MFSLYDELDITLGARADWPYFARWHYRSETIGPVRFVTLLWHAERPIGICLFTAPALSLAARNRYFGRSGRWSRLTLKALNRQLVCLARVVLHPTYRGAGLGSRFVRRSCELCPFPWIESLAQLGQFHQFLERAGFTRVDTPPRKRRPRARHSDLYCVPTAREKKRLISPETSMKSEFAAPVYYVFDNRAI